MQYYSRATEPRLRRITIRLSIFEIEFRARPLGPRQVVSNEERALRRAMAEQILNLNRQNARMRLALGF